MKLSEVLAKAKLFKPNQYDDSVLTAWVSELDGQLHATLFATRQNAPVLSAPYNHIVDPDVILLVPFPHDNLYVLWIMAMVDYFNQEYDLYSNDMAIYNKAYDAFTASYAQGHPQVSTGEITV